MDGEQSANTDEASDHEYDDEDDSCCDVFPFMQHERRLDVLHLEPLVGQLLLSDHANL